MLSTVLVSGRCLVQEKIPKKLWVNGIFFFFFFFLGGGGGVGDDKMLKEEKQVINIIVVSWDLFWPIILPKDKFLLVLKCFLGP